MKTIRKEIKIAATVHELLVREAGEYGLSHREYAEAVIRYFASRRLNPQSVKEGIAYGLHEALDKGVTKIVAMLTRQEEGLLRLIVESLKDILHEQINARILAEILINNLHQLSDLGPDALQQMVQKNGLYASRRKQDILKVYKGQKTA